MSQFRLNQVWTEREVGDWEACVATSYAMGLLYGGVTMPAPYTQAERERLEVVADEPQTLGASDVRAVALYGRKLRPPSVASSEAAFLARPGLGFCLTGVGSPVGAQVGTFTHEVFAVALDLNNLAVYDPLLPAGAAPVNRTVAHMVAWMNGIASHQVREIRKDEFVGGDTLTESEITPFADGPHTMNIPAGGRVDGWTATGTTPAKSQTFPNGSSFPADAVVVLDQTPDRAPQGTFYRCSGGIYGPPNGTKGKGLYIPNGQVTDAGPVNPVPPATGITPEEVKKITDAAVAKRDEQWEAKQKSSLHP